MTGEGGALLLLNDEDVGAVLGPLDLVEPLARALISYSRGRADSPARVATRSPRGLLAAMPAFLPGGGISVKLVSVFPHNSGHPSHQGLIAHFDAADGRPLCVMDARRITALRTAAVSALSVRELAAAGASVLAVLGGGAQARSHLEVLTSLRHFSEVRVAARRRESAIELASATPGARACSSFEEAVRGAQVVVCCTDAREPLLELDWIQGGAHVVSVGMGPELDRETVEAASVFAEWRGAVTEAPPAGAPELQGLDPDRVTELGEVLDGARPGRTGGGELTLFKSTGLGVEDAAAAAFVYEAARGRGLGADFAW